MQSNNNTFITVQLFLINSYIVVASVDACMISQTLQKVLILFSDYGWYIH